jgi:hypothetical protein
MLLAQARAAIEAMRVPTGAMIEEGHMQFHHGESEPEEAGEVWRAMIDAALQKR